MDKLAKYRKIVKRIVDHYGQFQASVGDIQTYAICNEKTDNYLLLDVGWQPNGRRQHAMPLHIRIKDSKVWLEWDGTDQEIAQQLIDAGIAEDDIIFPSFEDSVPENVKLAA